MPHSLDRRQFITRAAGIAGAASIIATAPRVLLADGINPAAGKAIAAIKPARLFEVGTVTYNLGKAMDVDTLIATCEKGGFKAVELRSTHAHGVEPDISKEQRKAVRDRFTKTKVKLFDLGSACEYHSEKADVVKQNIELSRKFIELAADVGAVGVKVRPNGLPKSVPVEATLKQIGHALQEVGKHAEKHKVEIHVEVHGTGTSHPPHMKTIMDVCAHPAVGVTWNSNDTDVKDGSIAEYFRMLAPHIMNVHMRDLYVNYPFVELFTLLKSINYNRYTLAEIPESSDPLRVMQYYRKTWELLSA
ncbi:MAG: TIM barrel protein [Phycisphaeraceae bacterium]